MNAKICKPSECEVIKIKITEEKFPFAFKNKLEELMDECGMSEVEARLFMKYMEFDMELVYHKGYGLFLIESDAINSVEIFSPYDGQVCDVEEDED